MTDEVTRASGKGWFPICRTSSLLLYALGAIFLLFGFLYVVYPMSTAQTIGQLGANLGLPQPPSDHLEDSFGGWLIFTLAYMIGAAACSFAAGREPTEPAPYLNILLVLKITSSLTGLTFFLTQDHYAFYLATFLVDGLLAFLIFGIRRHMGAEVETLKRTGSALRGTSTGEK